MQTKCPNCGHRLMSHRTDRQVIGRREVVLQWNICQRCRHVTLQNWFFEDTARAKERLSAERSRARKRATHLRRVRSPGGL